MLSVRNCGGSTFPKKLAVTTAPTKTSYTAGDALDLTGLVTTVTYSDDSTEVVTCTPSIATGTVIYEDTSSVTLSWTWPDDTDVTLSVDLPISVTRVLTGITMNAPTKATYYKGDALDLRGATVTATFNSGKTADVTSSAIFSPANGTTLSSFGTQTITATYTENSINKTASTSVTVTVKPVTWANGSDSEIVDMVAAADAGKIKLSDYWAVGDERTVTLGSMAATGVGESHNSESVTFVLMNVGGKTLSSGKECNFVVGLKNCLSTTGYMNSSDTNSGGWDKSARRTWCNSVFYNAVPSSFKGIFKQFKNKTGLYESQSTLSETTDWFALPAAKEVYPSYDHASNTWFSTTTEWNALNGFSYYNTSANRVKKLGNSGSAQWYWLRSPYACDSGNFCSIHSDGNANYYSASSARGLAPFGCI